MLMDCIYSEYNSGPGAGRELTLSMISAFLHGNTRNGSGSSLYMVNQDITKNTKLDQILIKYVALFQKMELIGGICIWFYKIKSTTIEHKLTVGTRCQTHDHAGTRIWYEIEKFEEMPKGGVAWVLCASTKCCILILRIVINYFT